MLVPALGLKFSFYHATGGVSTASPMINIPVDCTNGPDCAENSTVIHDFVQSTPNWRTSIGDDSPDAFLSASD